LVRFPLIFISGIFIPLNEMSGATRLVTQFSPLTYLVDALNHGMGQAAVMPWYVDIAALVLFTFVFVAGASFILKKRSMKGL
jgi:ABC-2 type transport system permease protein